MSFEFYGGLLALDLLQSEGYGAGKEQAEAVAEVGSTSCADMGLVHRAYIRTLTGDYQTSGYWRVRKDYDNRAIDPACYHFRYEPPGGNIAHSLRHR